MAVSGAWAGAQTHKVSKPETVVRAVGVYEWTGDLAKPTVLAGPDMQLLVGAFGEISG